MRFEHVDGCKLRNVSVQWAEDKAEPKWARAAAAIEFEHAALEKAVVIDTGTGRR